MRSRSASAKQNPSESASLFGVQRPGQRAGCGQAAEGSGIRVQGSEKGVRFRARRVCCSGYSGLGSGSAAARPSRVQRGLKGVRFRA